MSLELTYEQRRHAAERFTNQFLEPKWHIEEISTGSHLWYFSARKFLRAARTKLGAHALRKISTTEWKIGPNFWVRSVDQTLGSTTQFWRKCLKPGMGYFLQGAAVLNNADPKRTRLPHEEYTRYWGVLLHVSEDRFVLLEYSRELQLICQQIKHVDDVEIVHSEVWSRPADETKITQQMLFELDYAQTYLPAANGVEERFPPPIRWKSWTIYVDMHGEGFFTREGRAAFAARRRERDAAKLNAYVNKNRALATIKERIIHRAQDTSRRPTQDLPALPTPHCQTQRVGRGDS